MLAHIAGRHYLGGRLVKEGAEQMVIYQVTVTDGGDFDAVRFDALYRDKAKAESVAAQELARAQARYEGDEMASTFMRQVVADISPRHVR